MIWPLADKLVEYQAWRRFGELILVIGLGAELLHIGVIDWLGADLPEGVISKKRLAVGNIICTFLILFGVWVENTAGNRIDNVVRRMRAPRSLNAEQQKAVYVAISKVKPETIWVWECGDVSDSHVLRASLQEVLTKAHWTAWGNPGVIFGLRAIPVAGIAVETLPYADHDDLLAARTLVSALLDQDLAVDGPRPVDDQTSAGTYNGPIFKGPINLIVTIGFRTE